VAVRCPRCRQQTQLHPSTCTNDPSLRPISPHELFYGIQPPTKHFLPFRQRGYVVHTGPKTKLAPRSTLASFLHTPNEHQYIILLMIGKISACRPSEFTPMHIAAAYHAISVQSATPNSLASALRHPDAPLDAQMGHCGLPPATPTSIVTTNWVCGDTNSPVLATRLVQTSSSSKPSATPTVVSSKKRAHCHPR
jgi:hypothetical protein